MKKHLINNLAVSGVLLFTLFLISDILKYNLCPSYFLTIFFFLIIYVFQTLLLFRPTITSKQFMMVYTILPTLVAWWRWSIIALILPFLAWSRPTEVDADDAESTLSGTKLGSGWLVWRQRADPDQLTVRCIRLYIGS